MKGTKFMKIFEILDKENEISIGVLLYYEKEGLFISMCGIENWLKAA